jgi:hypothetical protein
MYFKKFCHAETVVYRAILITYLNSAWKNTYDTQINFRVTNIMFTSVTFRIQYNI